METQANSRPWGLLDTLAARWLAVAAWMGLIFFLSSQSSLPSPDDPWLDFLLKKTAHATVFGILALLWWRALTGMRLRWGWAWLLTVLYAVSDEFHQSFVANRHPAARDVLIDACGAAVMLALLWWRLRRGASQAAAGP